MEEEKQQLDRIVNELKAKCEAIEKRETERRQVEEKKHSEEIQFLKRTNQQLKVSQKMTEVSIKRLEFIGDSELIDAACDFSNLTRLKPIGLEHISVAAD